MRKSRQSRMPDNPKDNPAAHNAFAATTPEAINDIASLLISREMSFVELRARNVLQRDFLTLAELDNLFREMLKIMSESNQVRINTAWRASYADLNKLRSTVTRLKAIVQKHCPEQAIDELVVCA